MKICLNGCFVLILDEGLKPGDQLDPGTGADGAVWEVGRSSLREAIKTLCALGVLEVKRGTGTFVGYGDTSMLTKPLSWGLSPNQTSTRQVIEARSVIEVAFGRLGGRAGHQRKKKSRLVRCRRVEKHRNDRMQHGECFAFHLSIAHAAPQRHAWPMSW
jgi:DNA-binding FadR family transcriptional regulator